MIVEIIFSTIAFFIIWYIIFRVVMISERRKMLKDIVKKMESQLKRDLTKQFNLTPLDDKTDSPRAISKVLPLIESSQPGDAKKEMKKKLNKKLKEKLKK